MITASLSPAAPTETTGLSLCPWLFRADFSFLGNDMASNLTKNAESKPLGPKAAMVRGKQLAVDESPFNGVKFELAIVLVVWVLLNAALSAFTRSDFELFLLVFCSSLFASLWVGLRTRAVVRRLKQTSRSE